MGKGPKPEWLDDYIDAADEPLQEDLRELKTKKKMEQDLFRKLSTNKAQNLCTQRNQRN